MTRVIRLFVLVIISLICMVFGCMCLAIAMWLQNDQFHGYFIFRISADSSDLAALDRPSIVEKTGYLMAACGMFMVAVAIIGFLTAFWLQQAMFPYVTFISGLIIVVLLQLSALILLSRYDVLFRNHGEQFLNATLAKKYVGPYSRSASVSTAWDATQVALSCCGVRGQEIFDTLTTWNRTWVDADTKKVVRAVIPVTCCSFKSKYTWSVMQATSPEAFTKQLSNKTCPVTRTSSKIQGCYEVIFEAYRLFSLLFEAFSVINIAMQLSGIIAGIILVLGRNDGSDDDDDDVLLKQKQDTLDITKVAEMTKY